MRTTFMAEAHFSFPPSFISQNSQYPFHIYLSYLYFCSCLLSLLLHHHRVFQFHPHSQFSPFPQLLSFNGSSATWPSSSTSVLTPSQTPSGEPATPIPPSSTQHSSTPLSGSTSPRTQGFLG
uniref:Uncharacterized protein n=1 Tax=Cannabis sativa TaxID=3483 RepID=A0A803QX54_CANSA